MRRYEKEQEHGFHTRKAGAKQFQDKISAERGEGTTHLYGQKLYWGIRD
jgi:hypothetical protein